MVPQESVLDNPNMSPSLRHDFFHVKLSVVTEGGGHTIEEIIFHQRCR